jgi:hypothetical protein
MMSQTAKNLRIDVLLLIALICTTLSGLVLWLGYGNKPMTVFQNIPIPFWLMTHLVGGIIVLAGIIIHIAVHWKWFKSLRGRRLSEMPRKLRANRIVDRAIWIIFLATAVFGTVCGALSFYDRVGLMLTINRVHVGLGFTWLGLVITHLVFHRKWIAFTLRGLKTLRNPTNAIVLQRRNENEYK